MRVKDYSTLTSASKVSFAKATVDDEEVIQLTEKRFDSSTEALVDVWKKKHAGKRVKSLLDRNMFSRESHFYDDIIFMDWEDTKTKYLKSVGR